MLYLSYSIKNELHIKEYVFNSFSFLLKSFFMLVFIFPINYINISNFYRMILQVFVGCSLCFLLNLKYIKNIYIMYFLKKNSILIYCLCSKSILYYISRIVFNK